MPIISIDIPAHVKDRLEARAARTGRSFEEFVVAVLTTEADDIDYGAPADLTIRSKEDLEAKLAEIGDDVAVELTREDWDAMGRKLAERHRESA